MAGREPLAAHSLARTTDVDEARARVAEVFCAHRLDALDPSRFEAHFNSVTLGAVALSFLDYGAPVRIRPEEFDDFVLVQIPVAGAAAVWTAGAEVLSDPATASVPDPDRPSEMRWHDGNRQLIVRLDREVLDRQARLLGGADEGRARLSTAMDLTTPGARAWLQTVEFLRADAEHDRRLVHPVLGPHVERTVMNQLLVAHGAVVLGDEREVAPRRIRLAEQLIRDHAREPLTVDDVAEAVGASVRSLQEGFRRHLDTTPTALLREVRLQRVHADLRDGDPGATTVTAVATAWGFAHLGRFAVAYRRRFECSPSYTLRH